MMFQYQKSINIINHVIDLRRKFKSSPLILMASKLDIPLILKKKISKQNRIKHKISFIYIRKIGP